MTSFSLPVKIPSYLWLYIPVVFGVVHMTLQMTTQVDHLLLESGPYENAEFLIISIAFIISFLLLIKLSWKKQKWFFVWIALITAGSFYISGEEISWGQHIFQWQTPEVWEEVNDHDETNLHNTTKWLDQKPKTLVEFGIYGGGLIIPALVKINPLLLPECFAVAYPPAILAVTAGELLLIRLAKYFDKSTGLIGFKRVSEIQELLIYYFIMLYSIVLSKRYKSVRENHSDA